MKKFVPNLKWLEGSIIYLDHNVYKDKLSVFYRYKGENYYEELEPKKSYYPFFHKKTIAGKVYDQIKHLESYRALKQLAKNDRDNTILLPADTQFLIQSEKTFFENMSLSDLKMMAVDIETTGLDPHNNQILSIGCAGNYQFTDGSNMHFFDAHPTEKSALGNFIDFVKTEDPDILVFHNGFSFDLPFIEHRLEVHDIQAALGRFGKNMYKDFMESKVTPLKKGFKFVQYRIPGRYVVDTMHLAILEDTRLNELESYSLKYLAKKFNVAPKDRVYLDHEEINKMYYDDYEKFKTYLKNDLEETLSLANLFLPAYVAMSKVIPIGLQNQIYAGATKKLMSLFIGEYYRAEKPLPKAEDMIEFKGGLSGAEKKGIYKNIAKFDATSLYPSIMLTYGYFPKSDILGVFEKYLKKFTTDRLALKAKLKPYETKDSPKPKDKLYEEINAMQLALKILINSFYGVLGNGYFIFNDYDAASKVTAKGREILMQMADIIEKNNCISISLDTDGIYFSYPDGADPNDILKQVNDSLDDGISVEFEKSYVSMYSYGGKVYAALDSKDKLLIKGGAFKGRSLPKILRTFIKNSLMNLLKNKKDEFESETFLLKRALAERSLDVEEIIESKNIKYDYQTYISRDSGGKIPHFEAMFRDGITDEFKSGDKVSFYYSGDESNDKHEMAKIYKKENKINDYNVDHYIQMILIWEEEFLQYFPK